MKYDHDYVKNTDKEDVEFWIMIALIIAALLLLNLIELAM